MNPKKPSSTVPPWAPYCRNSFCHRAAGSCQRSWGPWLNQVVSSIFMYFLWSSDQQPQAVKLIRSLKEFFPYLRFRWNITQHLRNGSSVLSSSLSPSLSLLFNWVPSQCCSESPDSGTHMKSPNEPWAIETWKEKSPFTIIHQHWRVGPKGMRGKKKAFGGYIGVHQLGIPGVYKQTQICTTRTRWSRWKEAKRHIPSIFSFEPGCFAAWRCMCICPLLGNHWVFTSLYHAFGRKVQALFKANPMSNTQDTTTRFPGHLIIEVLCRGRAGTVVRTSCRGWTWRWNGSLSYKSVYSS